MKHILGMLKPYPVVNDTNISKLELDYLRLIYAVSQIIKQGDDAQGYFILTDSGQQNRLSQLEHTYRGNEYASVLSVSLESYLGNAERAEKTKILSGLVKAAILDTGSSTSTLTIRHSMRDFILEETILGLEPNARVVKDERKFPFRIQWDYYGVIEDNSAVRDPPRLQQSVVTEKQRRQIS